MAPGGRTRNADGPASPPASGASGCSMPGPADPEPLHDHNKTAAAASQAAAPFLRLTWSRAHEGGQLEAGISRSRAASRGGPSKQETSAAAAMAPRRKAGALLLPKGPPSCSGKLEDHASKLLFSQGAEIGIRQWRALGNHISTVASRELILLKKEVQSVVVTVELLRCLPSELDKLLPAAMDRGAGFAVKLTKDPVKHSATAWNKLRVPNLTPDTQVYKSLDVRKSYDSNSLHAALPAHQGELAAQDWSRVLQGLLTCDGAAQRIPVRVSSTCEQQGGVAAAPTGEQDSSEA